MGRADSGDRADGGVHSRGGNGNAPCPIRWALGESGVWAVQALGSPFLMVPLMGESMIGVSASGTGERRTPQVGDMLARVKLPRPRADSTRPRGAGMTGCGKREGMRITWHSLRFAARARLEGDVSLLPVTLAVARNGDRLCYSLLASLSVKVQ